MISQTIDAPNPARAVNVLIADASADAREAMAAALRASEPKIVLIDAGDGPAALDILRRRRVDIALLDCRLPKVDGAAMKAAIGACTHKPLLVLVSELLMPRWPAIAAQLGAYELMLKPSRPEQVEALLRAWRRMQLCASALLVDGTQGARDLIARMLAQSRFALDVTQSDGGLHAIKLARTTPFALAFVEASLPDMSGIEAAFQMLDKTPDLRVVVTGTNGDPALRSSLEQLGVSALLTKPFEAHDLENVLHDAFGLWRPYLLNATRDA